MHELFKPDLTLREEHQMFTRSRTNPMLRYFEDFRREASNAFSENPSFYARYFTNPFDQDMKDSMYISYPEIFSNYDLPFLMVMSEPDMGYEKRFSGLSWDEKREELHSQMRQSFQQASNMEKYVRDNEDAVWGMSDSDLYQELSLAIFGTNDQQIISDEVAKAQRKGMRFAILSFISDLQIIKGYRDEFQDCPKDLAEATLGLSFVHDVATRFLPIGIIFELHEEDYGRFEKNTERTTSENSTSGMMLRHTKIPKLGGRSIVIRANADTESAVNHEISHVVYENYIREGVFLESDNKLQEEGKAKYCLRVIDQFMNDLSYNEAIAYATTGKKIIPISLLSDEALDSMERAYARLQTALDPESEQELLKRLPKLREKFKEDFMYNSKIAEIVVRNTQADNPPFDMLYAQSMLRLTPFMKWERLLRFAARTDDVHSSQSMAHRLLAYIKQVSIKKPR